MKKKLDDNIFYLYIYFNILILFIIQVLLWISGSANYEGYYNIPDNFFMAIYITGEFLYSAICILLLKLSLNLRNKDNHFKRVLKKFGKYSYGIYLIHAGVLISVVVIVLEYLLGVPA